MYNSLGFKVFVNKPKNSEDSKGISEENIDSRYQKIIRLKKEKLCDDLL